MLAAHLVRGAVVGAIAALVLTGTATMPLLALLGAVFGAADALYLPAQQAFLPRTARGRAPAVGATRCSRGRYSWPRSSDRRSPAR